MHIWASKDRVTLWNKSYQRTEPDGTIINAMIDKVRVRYPQRQQVYARNLHGITSMAVRTIDPYNPIKYRDGADAPKSIYYTVSMSQFGGAGAKDDGAMGGFSSGEMVECYETEYKKIAAKLRKDGFKVKS